MGDAVVPRQIFPAEFYVVPVRDNLACNCALGNTTTKSSLMKQIEIIVPSVKELTSEKMVDIVCPFDGCAKIFANLPALQMHFTKGHSVSEESEMKKQISEELGLSLNVEYKKRECEQIFFCPIESCDRSRGHGNYFTRKTFVKYHFLRQHMERKFVCAVCQKGFALSYDLEKHQKVCGRVYPCSCGAIYRSRQALVTHSKRRNHTFPEVTVFKANSLGLKNYLKEQSESQREEVIEPADSSASIIILDDDVTPKRTINNPSFCDETSTSRSIPELDLSLDYVHADVDVISERERTVVSNEMTNNMITTTFNSSPSVNHQVQYTYNNTSSNKSDEPQQFHDLISLEPRDANNSNCYVLPKSEVDQEHRFNAFVGPNNDVTKSIQSPYTSSSPIQSATKITNCSSTDCNLVGLPQKDIPLQYVSDVKKEIATSCRLEPVKTPIYYINYGETQTDLVPQHSVQSTQTTSDSPLILTFKSGPDTSGKAKDYRYPRNRRKLVAISASIQTECSINSKGQRNRNLNDRTTSGVQTVRIAPQKTFSTIGTQTDIARKRAVNKKRKYQEVEVQTANRKVSHHSIDLQTNFSPQTTINLDSSDCFFSLDTPQSSCIGTDGNETIQTETQTMPFNMDEFFDSTKITTCDTSVSVDSPTFTDFGSFINLETPVFHSEVPAETQTNWDELFAEVESPFNPLCESEFF